MNGASNPAQWDWEFASDAMDAAKTTYAMLQGNKEEKRKQEEFELEKLLFPTKQKLLELEFSKTQAEIGRTNAMTDYYLGRNDADGLLSSSFGPNALSDAYSPVFGNDPVFGFRGSNAAVVEQSGVDVKSSATSSGFRNIGSTRFDGR
jgi:hypothetical protein